LQRHFPLVLFRFFPRLTLYKGYMRSLLKAIRSERFPYKFSVSPGYHNHQFSFFFLSFSLNTITQSLLFFVTLCRGWRRCFYITGSCCICSFFFRFVGGRPLHTVQSFTFCIPRVHLAVCLAISSLLVFLNLSAIWRELHADNLIDGILLSSSSSQR
jgi:hypothetical protein